MTAIQLTSTRTGRTARISRIVRTIGAGIVRAYRSLDGVAAGAETRPSQTVRPLDHAAFRTLR